MNHRHACENSAREAPHKPAQWKCEHLFFCEDCKEEIIENKGVGAYQWARLPGDFGPTERPQRRWPHRTFAKKPPRRAESKGRDVDPLALLTHIEDHHHPRGYRLVALTQKAWEAVRESLWTRARGLCERCHADAPLHARELAAIEPGLPPRIQQSGQGAHIAARKMGGGFRDDHPENLAWLCADCHRADPNCTFLQDQF